MLDDVHFLTAADEPQLSQFYQTVCAQQAHDTYSPDWHWGVYPNSADLASMSHQGQMIGGFQDGQLVAAGRVTQGEQPDYRDVPWTFPVADEDVAILHLFAVHPNFRGQGVSSAMLQAILKTLRDQGRRVVHLDVMAGNLPAEKLYVKNGFTFAQERTLHYQDVGETLARLFECRL